MRVGGVLVAPAIAAYGLQLSGGPLSSVGQGHHFETSATRARSLFPIHLNHKECAGQKKWESACINYTVTNSCQASTITGWANAARSVRHRKLRISFRHTMLIRQENGHLLAMIRQRGFRNMKSTADMHRLRIYLLCFDLELLHFCLKIKGGPASLDCFRYTIL